MALLSLLLVVVSSLMVSGRLDGPQGSLEAALAVAKNGEIDRHADLGVDDVGLGDLGLHRHGVELGDLEQGGGTLAGVEGLPSSTGTATTVPERGPGSGIPQVDPGGVHRDPGLHPLGLEGPDIGQGLVQGRPGAVMVGRAAKASCDYLLLALVCQASIAKGGLFGIQLGLEVVALCQGILEGVLLGQIVDLGQQIPCLTA